MNIDHAIMLQFLFLLNPTIGLKYVMFANNTYAFPKDANIQFCNCVFNDARITNQDVQAVIDYYKGTKFDWYIDSKDSSSALLLEQNGLIKSYECAAMIYNLEKLNDYEENISVKEIDCYDEIAKKQFLQVCVESFESENQEEDFRMISYLITCIENHSLLHMYVAYQEDRAVACGTMIQNNEKIVSIFTIGVIPEQRGKGFAKTIVKKALFDAKQNGCKIATLLATNMGKPVYKKLGFEEYTTYSVYTRRMHRLPTSLFCERFKRINIEM